MQKSELEQEHKIHFFGGPTWAFVGGARRVRLWYFQAKQKAIGCVLFDVQWPSGNGQHCHLQVRSGMAQGP